MEPSSLISTRSTSRDDPQNFIALKQLKEADLQYSTLCNRIKVMEMNEQKNVKRIKKSQQQLNRILRIRDENYRQIQMMRKVKATKENSIDKQKIKNGEVKEMIQSRIRQNLEQISAKKVQNREKVQKQSQKHEKQIIKEKENNLQEKQKNRDIVATNEIKSQENIRSFMKNKEISLHLEKMEEKDLILKKKSKKTKQIENLSQVEMGMLQKFSQSQVAYRQMKSKLDNMLGRIRQDKKQKNEALLPSFHDSGKAHSLHRD